MSNKPRYELDEFDLEAERQAKALRSMREMGVAPAVLGKRLTPCKSHQHRTKVATSRIVNIQSEKKIGFGKTGFFDRE